MIKALAFAVLFLPAAALAQTQPLPVAPAPSQQGLSVDVTASSGDDLKIAVPVLATDEVRQTEAGGTDALGRQIADVIAADLRGSGLFRPIGPGGVPTVQFAEANAPNYAIWPQTGAEALVSGFVRAGGDGQLTVGCYLYDVNLKSELKRTGFVVAPRDWRRARARWSKRAWSRILAPASNRNCRWSSATTSQVTTIRSIRTSCARLPTSPASRRASHCAAAPAKSCAASSRGGWASDE